MELDVRIIQIDEVSPLAPPTIIEITEIKPTSLLDSIFLKILRILKRKEHEHPRTMPASILRPRVMEVKLYTPPPTAKECGYLAEKLLKLLLLLRGLNILSPEGKRRAAPILDEVLENLSNLKKIREIYENIGMWQSLNIEASFLGYELARRIESKKNTNENLKAVISSFINSLDEAINITENAHVAGIISDEEAELIMEEIRSRRERVLNLLQ